MGVTRDESPKDHVSVNRQPNTWDGVRLDVEEEGGRVRYLITHLVREGPGTSEERTHKVSVVSPELSHRLGPLAGILHGRCKFLQTSFGHSLRYVGTPARDRGSVNRGPSGTLTNVEKSVPSLSYESTPL